MASFEAFPLQGNSVGDLQAHGSIEERETWRQSEAARWKRPFLLNPFRTGLIHVNSVFMLFLWLVVFWRRKTRNLDIDHGILGFPILRQPHVSKQTCGVKWFQLINLMKEWRCKEPPLVSAQSNVRIWQNLWTNHAYVVVGLVWKHWGYRLSA